MVVSLSLQSFKVTMAALTFLLSGCEAPHVQKTSAGWVTYSGSTLQGSNASDAEVSFSQVNDCIVLTTSNGRQYVPVMPTERQISVQPESALYNGRWMVRNLSVQGKELRRISDNAIIASCGFNAATFQDIQPIDAPPPPL